VLCHQAIDGRRARVGKSRKADALRKKENLCTTQGVVVGEVLLLFRVGLVGVISFCFCFGNNHISIKLELVLDRTACCFGQWKRRSLRIQYKPFTEVYVLV
jgi:hypothetical protein